jgi:hypothetical protein
MVSGNGALKSVKGSRFGAHTNRIKTISRHIATIIGIINAANDDFRCISTRHLEIIWNLGLFRVLSQGLRIWLRDTRMRRGPYRFVRPIGLLLYFAGVHQVFVDLGDERHLRRSKMYSK